MSTNVESERTAAERAGAGGGLRMDRIVIGLLLSAVGVAWLLDLAGESVPWRMFPAGATILIGVALLATLIGGRGRGALIAMGVVTTLLGVAIGVGVDRYQGPVGDHLLAPTSADWPIQERISAGTITVDLTRHPLPDTGRLEADVGAGRIVVLLPPERSPRIEASVTAGSIAVDGVKVDDGVDLRWTGPAQHVDAVQLVLHVGLGDIEVDHG
jgi:hypothetical protein